MEIGFCNSFYNNYVIYSRNLWTKTIFIRFSLLIKLANIFRLFMNQLYLKLRTSKHNNHYSNDKTCGCSQLKYKCVYTLLNKNVPIRFLELSVHLTLLLVRVLSAIYRIRYAKNIIGLMLTLRLLVLNDTGSFIKY